MLTRLSLAAIAGLMLSASSFAQPTATTAEKLNAVLCKTESEAIALARSIASGKTEPIAINLVNKQAGAEVCGRYIGYAVLEIEKTTNYDGALFMIAGLRFVEDNALAWTASWVAPFNGAGLSRGT